MDGAVLQGLAQGLEDLARKLRQLVEEEDAVVGEGDLPRAGHRAAADQGDVAGRVVWGPEGSRSQESRVPGQESADRVDLGGLEALLHVHGGQDPAQASCQHRLPGNHDGGRRSQVVASSE